MSDVGTLNGRTPFRPVPGVEMRAWWGSGILVNRVVLERDAVVPLHSHPEEQIGIILDGELLLTVDGVDHRIGTGEAYTLPPNVEHQGVAGSAGCTLIDVFCPVRSDYRTLQLAADKGEQ